MNTQNEISKLFFIVGMRRSGTTILQKLISQHSNVNKILFEPYELWYAIRVSHLARYRNNIYVKKQIKKFRNSFSTNKYKGAKFALNAGIEAMTWKRLSLVFPEAKFIFIVRNREDTYNSWIKVDNNPNCVRGIVSKEMYMPWRNYIVNSFWDFIVKNKNSIIVHYEDLVENADNEMIKVWNLLNIKPLTNLNQEMRQPENWSKK